MPALMLLYRLLWLLPTMRTVLALQFCSWSACRIRSLFSASATTGSTS